MKNLFLIAFITLFSITVTAQKSNFGLVAGYHNLGQKVSVDPLSVTVNASGFYAGFFGEFSLGESINFQPELLFSTASLEGESLNELLIPLMIKYYVSKEFSLSAGPQLDLILEDTGDETKSLGIGLGLGAAYELSESFFLSTRYSLGLTNRIDDTMFNSSLKINTFQVGLGYRF